MRAALLPESAGMTRIGTESLPDLVTFADVSDPKSVLRVDSGVSNAKVSL